MYQDLYFWAVSYQRRPNAFSGIKDSLEEVKMNMKTFLLETLIESLNWKLKKQTLCDLIIISQRYAVRSEMAKYLKYRISIKYFLAKALVKALIKKKRK